MAKERPHALRINYLFRHNMEYSSNE